MKVSFLNPRHRSLARANALIFISLIAAFVLSDFPHNRPTLLLAIPSAVAILGTVDTVRCMRSRWSFYHAGVLLCVYMDLMIVSMILFLFLYPFAFWLTSSH